MSERGAVEQTQGSNAASLGGVLLGVVLGVALGGTIKGSGMFYTNVFLAVSLLLVLALAALAAVAAALTRHKTAARAVTLFIAATVVAAAVAFAIAPSYRSPTAGVQRSGSVTVHIVEPRATDWVTSGTCQTLPDRSLVVVYADIPRRDGVDARVLVNVSLGATAVPSEFTIMMYTATAGSANYHATGANGVEPTGIAADGMSGSIRFSVPAEANGPSRGIQPGALSGTVVWDCS